MRSKFVLIVGCIIVAAWVVGITAFLVLDAMSNPLRLQLLNSGIGVGGRIGTTTVVLVSAVVGVITGVLLVAFAVRRSRQQLSVDGGEEQGWLATIREALELKRRTSRGKRG